LFVFRCEYHPDLCATPFTPCSTFKIPNSLIGLETGVIPDTAFVIAYDAKRHPGNETMRTTAPFCFWFQDLSLKRAFRYSCIWYYQELARRVGALRMEEYLKKMGYGNLDISSGVDTFWQSGSLKISAREQIEFLKKMYDHRLPGISSRTIDLVRDMMLYESGPGYRLYGKTGGGIFKDHFIGWYVGFVETTEGIWYFAMNIFVDQFSDLARNYRIEFTKKVLARAKVI
jgi:beta-lactamase class D